MKKIFTILFLLSSVVMASPVKAQVLQSSSESVSDFPPGLDVVPPPVVPPPVAPPLPLPVTPIPEPQPEEPQKIPEPSSIAGILALGVLGATSLRRRQTKSCGNLTKRT